MPTDPPPLPARDDTLLGVCEGLGEEFGANPIWLRLALGAIVLWSPLAAIAAYLALGLMLLVARLLEPAAGESFAGTPIVAANDPAASDLPLAA